MKYDSKSLIAIFAVALMLGGGLVPFCAVNTDAEEASVADDDSGTFSLESLIEALKTIKESAGSIELNDSFTLVSVEDGGEPATKEIPGTINGYYHLQDKELLSADTIFTKNEEKNEVGRIIVENGGTLELFPLMGCTQSFSLTNNNPDEPFSDVIIELKTGAKISVFGLTFMIVSHGKSTEVPDNIHFFVLKLGTSVTFSYNCDSKNDADTYDVIFSMALSENAEFLIFGTMAFDYSENYGTEALRIEGTMTKKDNGFKLTDGVFEIDSGHGRSRYHYKFTNVALDATNKATVSGSKVTQEFAVSLSMDIEHLGYMVENEYGPGFTIYIGNTPGRTYGTFSTGLISGKVELTVDEDFIPYEKTLTVSASKIELDVDECIVQFRSLSFDNMKDVKIAVSDLSLGLKKVWNDVAKEWATSGIDFKVGLSAEISQVYIDRVTRSDDIAGHRTVLTGFKASVPSLVLKMTENGMTMTMESAGMSSDVRYIAVSFDNRGEMTEKTLFSFDAAIGITGLNFTTGADGMNLAADAGFNVHMFYDGLDRNLTLKLDDIYAKIDAEGINAGIKHIQFVNTIPWKNVLKSLNTTLMDNLEIDLNVYNLKLAEFGIISKSATIVSDQVTLLYKNFGNTEEVYAELNNEVTTKVSIYSITSPIIQLSCGNVSGYIKNIGKEKENFSVSSVSSTKPVVFSVSHYTSLWSLYTVYIMQGNAEFGKGVVPVNLAIGKDVKFHAEGLSAYAFTFGEGCQASGYVTMDTDDGMYQATYVFAEDNKTPRFVYRGIIYSYSEYEYDTFDLHQYVESGDGYVSAGYTFKMDLDTLKCTVTANDGYTLPDQKTIEEYSTGISIESLTGKEMKFDFDFEGYGDLRFKCLGDNHWLRFDGFSYLDEMCRYGNIVTLPELTDTPKPFVGWKDAATGDIYTDLGSFVMPARDVTLVAVFVDEGVVAKQGSTATIDARGNDVTSIDVKEIESHPEIQTVEIISDTANVSMDIDTFKKITELTGGTIYVNCNMVQTANNETTYSVTITDERANPVSYTSDTQFEVVAKNVKADQGVTGFHAFYVDEYGHYQDVGVKSYTKNSDGTYDVVFTVNHFSTFAIEPVYTDYGNIPALAITIIVLVAILAGVYKLYGRFAKQ